MKPITNANTHSAVADLHKNWATLNILDRARAVDAIHQTGTSLRQLAKSLGCAESLLRHLLQALQASPQDQELARYGKLSINELVRRSKAVQARQAAKDREELEIKRTQVAQRVCEDICNWLEENGINGIYGEQIVDEARRLLVMAEQDGKLPPYKTPPNTPLAEIIQRVEPHLFRNSDISVVGWFAAWLARWTYFAMPDSLVRDRALNLALDKQIRK
jgi:transposase-like protein